MRASQPPHLHTHPCPALRTCPIMQRPGAAVFSYCQWRTAVPFPSSPAPTGKYIKKEIKANVVDWGENVCPFKNTHHRPPFPSAFIGVHRRLFLAAPSFYINIESKPAAGGIKCIHIIGCGPSHPPHLHAHPCPSFCTPDCLHRPAAAF